jgi:DNA-binding transcriptional regulator YhcF (GntR family)
VGVQAKQRMDDNHHEAGIAPITEVSLPDNVVVPLERVQFVIDRSRSLVGQIAEQIAHLVVIGIFQADERLPPVDEAARSIGVGANTMGQIYAVLTKYGIATSTTGTGTFFTRAAARSASRYLVSSGATSVIRRARALGLAEEDVVGVFLAALARVEHDAENEIGAESPEP